MTILSLSVWYYHQTTFLQLTTFLQFCLASSILPQSPYFFLWYFSLDVVFTDMNFSSFIIAWRKWNVIIYTVTRCCLILKALGAVQCCIFCLKYIPTTSLDVLHAEYKSRERSERSFQSLMIFDEGGVKLVAAT